MLKKDFVEYISQFGFKKTKGNSYEKEYTVFSEKNLKTTIKYIVKNGKVTLWYKTLNNEELRKQGNLKNMYIEDNTLYNLEDI